MKKIMVLVLFLLTIFFVSGCSKKDKKTIVVPKTDALVIISPHWEGVRREFGDAFKIWYEKKYAKQADIEWLDQGGSGDDLRFVKSEFAKNPSTAGIDIFFGGGVEPFMELEKKGYTFPFKISKNSLERIPGSIFGMPVYSPSYNWYGACLSGFGIVYNKAVLKMMNLKEPKTWQDLSDPKLMGWVGSSDPRHSGSIHMMYEIILQAYGWEKGFQSITKMSGNIKSFSKYASDTPKDVSTGQVAYGLAIDAYGWAQVAQSGEDKVGFMLPENLTVINPDAICILKGAPHLELAKAFMEFVMSEDGQKLWMLKKNIEGGPKEFELDRLSVMPDIYDTFKDKTVIKVNPFKYKGAFKYDPEKGSLRYTILNDFIGATVIDTHKELVRAWKAIIKGGMKKAAVEKFLEIPQAENEILEMASKNWNDPVFRNQKIKEWIEFSKKKYIEAEKLAK